jgi:hypothetical protein
MNITIKNEINGIIKYNDLLKKFIDLSLKYFSKNIFENKKGYIITLSNILSSWVFSQYQIKYNGFFPIYSNLNLVIDIFKDLSQIKNSNKYLFFELEFKSYYNLINNKNYVFDDNIQIYNKKKMIHNKLYIIFESNNIQSNELKILKYNYDKLRNFYNGEPKLFNFYIWVILLRYNILSSNNHQLGISPIIINKLKNDFNLIHELFASPINCTLNSYCSIYLDVEKYFGSVGNFFSYDLKSGFYTFNPPYQVDIIEKGINKLFSYLDKNEKYGFFITVPIWDNEGKSNFNLNEKVIYNDFEIMYKVKKSKYLKLKLEIPKEKFSYLDHNNFNVKNITIQNTYVFILANYDDNFDNIKNYDFYNII